MKATDIIIKMWENNNTDRAIKLHEYSDKTGLCGHDLKDAMRQAYEIQFEKFVSRLRRGV